MALVRMNTSKINICFNGKLNTKAIAQLTAIFSTYRINILDINMSNIAENLSTLNIVCQSSSTTDEIDSFWDEIASISKCLDLSYSKHYIE